MPLAPLANQPFLDSGSVQPIIDEVRYIQCSYFVYQNFMFGIFL